MARGNLTRLFMALVAIAALAVPGASKAQDSILSESDKRLIYSRVFEAIL